MSTAFTIVVIAAIAAIVVMNAHSDKPDAVAPPTASAVPARPAGPAPAPAPVPIPIPNNSGAAAPAPGNAGQVVYSVTGTKAESDQITITFTDASGVRRTLQNVSIPWMLALTPISPGEVGSVEATSLLGTSTLNCSITGSDGKLLSSNEKNQSHASC